MSKVFIVTVNSKPSSEGYSTADKAKEFIKSRSDNPISFNNEYTYVSNTNVSENNFYQIFEINVK